MQKVVKFHNTCTGQVGGVIVMELDGSEKNDSLMVVINATEKAQTQAVKESTGYTLHSAHKHFGADKAYGAATFSEGEFTVPARSVAVFVKNAE